jgi:hypothetical protein
MRLFKYALAAAAGALMLAPLTAAAGPLTIVNVSAHALECAFSPTCTIAPTNLVIPITIPGVGGTSQLRTRTFLGVAGSPGAGRTAYAYRVDLIQAKATTGTAINCVSKLVLDFGPDTKINYGPLVATHAPMPSDVFVITSGGPGTIGLASAVRTGKFITFTFSTPICPGTPTAAALIPGKSSFLFGLAAAGTPMTSAAQVVFSLGGNTSTTTQVPTH